MCTRCFFPLGVSSTSNQKVCSFTIYAVFIFIYSFTHFLFCIHRLTEVMNAKAAIRSEYARLEAPSVQVLPSPPLTNVNNEGRKNIEQDTLISSKEKNIVKAKEAVVPTPPALLNNISSPVKNPVHLRFDRSTKNYDSNTNDSVLESAAQSEKNARKENSGNATVVFVHRPPPVLDPALKPVPLTKHTTKANRQGKDEEDISIASEDASDAGPSLEFLKSVEKSNMKLLGVNSKDHKQVEKGPHLTLQQDRNPDETLGETWSIIKLPHSIIPQDQQCYLHYHIQNQN